jgi:phage gp36-like protein
MYCTSDDLTRLLPASELLDLADDTGAASLDDPGVQAVLAEAVDQADREIDAYVGMVKSVPLDPVPPLVANLSAKCAVHGLYIRRPGLSIPDSIAEAYRQALQMLGRIAAGQLSLGQKEDGTTEEPGTVQMATTTGARRFTPSTWSDFRGLHERNP